MSYKSQHKAWAVDRAIELHKAAGADFGLADVKTTAGDLVEFTYEAEMDFESAVKRIADLIKELPNPLEKVQQLQGELAVIEEQINHQQSRAEH